MDAQATFLDKAEAIVGADNVVRATPKEGYIDPYPLNPGRAKWPGVRPGSVEDPGFDTDRTLKRKGPSCLC